jgi:hypothetical protein
MRTAEKLIETTQMEANVLGLMLQKYELVRNHTNNHHSYLKIDLNFDHIDNNTKIRDPIIKWLMILYNYGVINFDIILAKEKWVKVFARKIKKPYISSLNQKLKKKIFGKTILIISHEFYIPIVDGEIEKITSFGGRVNDIISVIFDRENHAPSILRSIEKKGSYNELKIHSLLSKEKILKVITNHTPEIKFKKSKRKSSSIKKTGVAKKSKRAHFFTAEFSEN